jgi:hypothetical protein
VQPKKKERQMPIIPALGRQHRRIASWRPICPLTGLFVTLSKRDRGGGGGGGDGRSKYSLLIYR